jgi:hypothetical protein
MLKTATVAMAGITFAVLSACIAPPNDPLAVAMLETPSPAAHGQVAVYVVAVRNATAHAIENIQLQVGLGANGSTADVLSETAPCQGAAGQQACQVGVLPMGNIKRYTFRVRVPASGKLTAYARVEVSSTNNYTRQTSIITTSIR